MSLVRYTWSGLMFFEQGFAINFVTTYIRYRISRSWWIDGKGTYLTIILLYKEREVSRIFDIGHLTFECPMSKSRHSRCEVSRIFDRRCSFLFGGNRGSINRASILDYRLNKSNYGKIIAGVSDFVFWMPSYPQHCCGYEYILVKSTWTLILCIQTI